MHSIAEAYKAVQLLAPQVATSTATGTGIDLGPDYLDDAVAVFSLGAASGTSPTCAVTIEGSDTVGGTYTNLGTFTTAGGTDDNKIAAIRINPAGASARFVRAVATIGGTTPSFAIAVDLLVAAQAGKSGLNSATLAAS